MDEQGLKLHRIQRQPGGVSVVLHKLVEEARRVNSGKDKMRHSKEVTYRFLSAMAGNFPGFEEATRALFAGDSERFECKDQASTLVELLHSDTSYPTGNRGLEK
ncbi:MAG: DUF2239 family protein [Deltaproteobacteria bacterium]|nr:DUF2239 family protein [Deltaproteobacteria bacterium]